jgi:hypothetical protein
VERELGRLRERAREHEQQDRQVERIGADQVATVQQRGQIVGSPDLAQKQQADQKRESAAAGDEQRLERGRPRRLLFVAEADQQIRTDAGHSQKTNSVSTLPASTRPSIAPMNKSRKP